LFVPFKSARLVARQSFDAPSVAVPDQPPSGNLDNWFYDRSSKMPASLRISIALFCLLIAASDLHARRVPNTWLWTALLAATVLFGTLWALGRIAAPWPSLLGFAIGLLILLPVYAMGWMGAGDVKYFAVLGFLLGAKALLPVWIIASLLAGIHAVFLVVSRFYRPQAVQALHAAHDKDDGRTILKSRPGTPYAACLSAGALIVLFDPALAQW
jgi:prepilin peptidase CpaA